MHFKFLLFLHHNRKSSINQPTEGKQKVSTNFVNRPALKKKKNINISKYEQPTEQKIKVFVE